MNWLKRISLKQCRTIKWLYFTINVIFARLIGKPLVLCFHRVKMPSGSLLDKRIGVTKPSDLEEIIRCLRIAGYQFIPLERLVQIVEKGNHEKVVAITFDDGLSDLYENAFPIMKKYNIPFTCFLITSLIGSTKLLWLHKLYIAWDKVDRPVRDKILEDYIEVHNRTQNDMEAAHFVVHFNAPNRLMEIAARLSEAANINSVDEELLAKNLYLNNREIQAMQAHGLSVELHGHYHWPMERLTEEETRQELETSLTIFRETFQTRARFLALPYGKTNPYLNDIAGQLGIKGLFTMQSRLISGCNIEWHKLPRFCIYDDVQTFYRDLCGQLIRYCIRGFSKN